MEAQASATACDQYVHLDECFRSVFLFWMLCFQGQAQELKFDDFLSIFDLVLCSFVIRYSLFRSFVLSFFCSFVLLFFLASD